MEFLESDWKVFSRLHPIAVERYYQKVDAQITAIANDPSRSPRERFHDIRELIEKSVKEARDMFTDLRRSTAFIYLFLIRSEGWITDEEMTLFSQKLQDYDMRRLAGIAARQER